MRSPLFSATELIDSKIDLARVFCVADTLCESGSVTATSAEIGEAIVEELSSTTTLSDESTWQARMDFLPVRPAVDCERVVLGVCMVDNRSGVFCLIQTSLGGTNNRSYMITREGISVQLRHDHDRDSSQFGVRAVVTAAESYDVLVGGAVLYLMGFWMDYWTEIATYCLGSQSGDGHMSELPVRFISRDRPLGSSTAVLASVAGFNGVLTWSDDLLERNRSAEDTPVYEEVEEMVSLAAAVSSSLDVPLWVSCHALQHEVDRLVKKAWSGTSLSAEA
ncbi:hypothetical protein AXG93_242s1210 [Marchantia polymorpha subsp. ruderalis]|uniref:Uncharacterized protein n=1 Tax=Marchantia polymorpha subsp. ruderalis TaxID=1480154 RepID=A0A176VM38_MARPO|nr:hypothetical protein AXG93_242s1210 [Marchantia polymorpha subsp. ruderalis]